MVCTRLMLLRNLSITLLSLFLLSCTSEEENEVHSLANDDKFKSGVHYELIDNPSTVRDPSKIEVIEVFWFGCNHCYALEPYLIRWKKDLPKDVAFSKSPATWNEILKIHARIYYTAKALGIEQQFIPAAFNTIQNEGRRLTGNTELEYFFKGFNVDREKYKSVSKSFGVNNALDQADKKMKQWEVTGVPALIVNGKYRVSASRAVGTDSLFDVVNFLIEKERKYSATK
ncbi:MAG: disulfide bond formation protein DsbA [Gammaproteobacteria bacterium]|nr:disulfide bond formation protein DsbA [Gammaproteobacteria bacterium]HJM59378.1 thiol:disulfide interchange protein DsbA/DsbL [SAR86 cluster bacterium]